MQKPSFHSAMEMTQVANAEVLPAGVVSAMIYLSVRLKKQQTTSSRHMALEGVTLFTFSMTQLILDISP